jgi:Mn2+/Fe2+ NRAMP family transporter
MAQPFGPWLVGIVGMIIIAVGGYQAYRASSAKFRETLKLGEMSQSEETWATRAGRIGFAARAVVYAIIGGFLVQAALHADPNQAGGLSKALQTLANQTYGPWVLGIVAVGLIAYGIFSVVEARYRQILAA